MTLSRLARLIHLAENRARDNGQLDGVDWLQRAGSAPHANTMTCHNEKLIELLDVVSENVVQPLDRHVEGHVVAKTKGDDSHVWLTLAED